MSLHTSQKMLLHVYAQAAALDDPTYRNHLREAAGCVSAADPTFSQAGFEAAMASLETVLWQRVLARQVPDPRAQGNRYIRAEFHWRDRLPRQGLINSRQAYRIQGLWTALCNWLPEEQRSVVYLAGIIRQATGRPDLYLSGLTEHQAAQLIDALKDRIAHAVKAAQPAEAVPA